VSADRARIGGREQLPPRVAAALAVVEIPPSKGGAIRRARRWLAGHPDARGEVISMQDAILTGRAVGDVLEAA